MVRAIARVGMRSIIERDALLTGIPQDHVPAGFSAAGASAVGLLVDSSSVTVSRSRPRLALRTGAARFGAGRAGWFSCVGHQATRWSSSHW